MPPNASILVEQANAEIGEHALNRPERMSAEVYILALAEPFSLKTIHGPYRTVSAATHAARSLGYNDRQYRVFYAASTRGAEPHPSFIERLDEWCRQLAHLQSTYSHVYESMSLSVRRPDIDMRSRARLYARRFEYLVRQGRFDSIVPVVYWDAAHVVGFKGGKVYLIVRLRSGRMYFPELPDPEEAVLALED